MADEDLLARLHYELIDGLIARGRCPARAELAERIDRSEPEVDRLLEELAAIHGVVLHPHVAEPWIVHPFSTTPTINWVEGERGSWWAPCLWCALGITALLGGKNRIHSRYGAEAEPLVLDVRDGTPVRNDISVHFAIPPARAWNNVHQHCSLVLPFDSPESICGWCERHGVAMGEAVPLQAVAALARGWYGSHASPHWRKWTVDQAQDIFTRAGLISEFWRLQARPGHF